MISRYGRYEVLHKLGQGAMAQVFLARDPLLLRFVAVKVLHADLATRKDVLQRFFTEARTVAAVRNPHVVEVFDFGQEGKDLYLVMEFVDGLSLQGMLRRIGTRNRPAVSMPDGPGREAIPALPLDATITAALMCQAAEGLSVAAQHGVVHRDIKPENLMINRQGYLKISDFGIAHVQDESITKTGAVLGSPLYMSPEQARGLKPITSQADMFSLGAVFYACLAGHPPFQGRTLTELFRKIAAEPHAPLGRIRPELDPALIALIDTLLHKEPALRGGGPRWLHRQLKIHLLSAGASDAPELIGGYLQELSSNGVQTTWRLEPSDARAETLPAASTLPVSGRSAHADAGGAPVFNNAVFQNADREPPQATIDPDGAHELPIAALGAVVGVLFLAAAVAWLGYRQFITAPARDARVHLEIDPGRDGNPTGTDGGGGESGAVVGGLGLEALEGQAKPSGRKDDSGTAPGDSAVRAGADGELASLQLKSAPPFAEAFIDGRYVGVTPVKVELLTPGPHRMLLKLKGAPAFDTTFSVKAGAQGFKFNLEAGPLPRLAVTPEAEL
jgi:serine/threonine protein kinase